MKVNDTLVVVYFLFVILLSGQVGEKVFIQNSDNQNAIYLPVAELQARQHLQDVLIEEEPFTFHCSGATIHVTDFKDLVVIGDNPCEISPDIEDRRQNDQTVIVLDDSHTFPKAPKTRHASAK